MRRNWGTWGATLIAGVAGFAFAVPVLYELSVSLMTPAEIRTLPPAVVPQDPQFANYLTGWNGVGLSGLLFTTVLLAVLAAALQILTGAAAAFALARLRFPGRRALVRVVIVLAAIPSIVLLVPRYVMVDAWGWSGEFTGLAAPALVSAGAILFLYQVFRTLPREPEESARLDGAGHWQVFSRVVVPQARPALVVVAAFAMLAQWRGLLWPLVVSRRAGPEVVEQGLARRLVEGASGLTVPEFLAVGVIIAIPALAVATWVTLSRARTTSADRARMRTLSSSFEGQLPTEISPLTPGPFEHQIL
ncbi:MAG TPA: carbohydrate ABC transporter permease [Gemmatimonadales bacterium]|nr:carbohydrate ABC transporter permease [Gemmatimonadales bacterium]